MRRLFLLLSANFFVFGATITLAQDIVVGITESIHTIDVNHQGTLVKVKRVQDPANKLVDDFAKTSRPCPPFCINPMSVHPAVKTFGEVELLDFVTTKVEQSLACWSTRVCPSFITAKPSLVPSIYLLCC